MKRLIFYRIIVIALVAGLLFSFNEYKNKKCIENKVVKEEIVNPNYVFFGDSITNYCDFNKYFDNLPIVNSGICGDKTEDLLNRIDDIYEYNPSKIFILIGINDLLFENHDDKISKDIDEIAKKIKKQLPYVQIYIESIYPNTEGYYGYVSSDRIKKINNEIKEICKNNNYTYINLFDKLKDEKEKLDKKYTDDGLHINNEGYKIVTSELKKYLN